ncbi:hypothetical protein EMCRGX_G008580 [Ephydatia muelleri]
MKKENASLYWTVALYLALSTICVSANKLYPKYSDVEDTTVENKLVGPIDDDRSSAESNGLVQQEQYKISNVAYYPCLNLPDSQTLARSHPIAVISGKADYRLTFDIIPTGYTYSWGSILHFTTINDLADFGSRSPALWFWPGTTRLFATIGDTTNFNWGLDTTDALPLNVRTAVTIECKGKDVKLIVGTRVYPGIQPTVRYAGNLIVYASDPWYEAAKASLYNIDYEILPTAAAAVNADEVE